MVPKLKIYAETICCGHFIFSWKKILLLILQTLFTENWPIYDNFDPNLFLVESIIDIHKNGLKINFELDFEPFLFEPFHYLT